MVLDSDSLYYLLLRVIRLHYHRSHTLLEEIGVYPGQPPLLYILHQKGGLSQTELANELKIKPSTITVMLNHMEKEELVKREKDPDDQRISRVYLTKKGKELFSELDKKINSISKECFANFNSEERIILRRLLKQIAENLERFVD